jgi:stage V sporulation protein SpoVS
MSEKTSKEPVPFYTEKSAMIAVLGEMPREGMGAAIGGIGELLAEAPGLTNTQRERFIDALQSSGLLFYKTDYLRETDEDESIPVDGAQWKLEQDGRLQEAACILTYQFYSGDVSRADLHAATQALFNTAHKSSRGRRDYLETDGTEEACVTAFSKYEQAVFSQKDDIVEKLVDLKIMDKKMGAFLTEIPAEDIKSMPEYDSIIVHPIFEAIQATREDRISIFFLIQKLLYSGWGMGLQDNDIRLQKEDSLLE